MRKFLKTACIVRTKKTIAAMALMCAIAIITFVGCSSDEPSEPKVEFKTTAAELNGHLEEGVKYDVVGIPFTPLYIKAKDAPEIEKCACAEFDVVEIPGKGGTYDIKLWKDWILHDISSYEDVPFLSHETDLYDLFNGECVTYDYLIKNRLGPDSVVSIEEYNNQDVVDSKGRRIVTYTFPENRTGHYRLIRLRFECTWRNLAFPTEEIKWVTSYGYFIQLPN